MSLCICYDFVSRGIRGGGLYGGGEFILVLPCIGHVYERPDHVSTEYWSSGLDIVLTFHGPYANCGSEHQSIPRQRGANVIARFKMAAPEPPTANENSDFDVFDGELDPTKISRTPKTNIYTSQASSITIGARIVPRQSYVSGGRVT